MWKVAALLGLIWTPAMAHELSPDQCDVDDLYEIAKQTAVGPFGIPESAVFPDIEGAGVTQQGSICWFDFDFEVGLLNGTTTKAGVEIAIYRLWNPDSQSLSPPIISVDKRR
jgi:hypothetical protein